MHGLVRDSRVALVYSTFHLHMGYLRSAELGLGKRSPCGGGEWIVSTRVRALRSEQERRGFFLSFLHIQSYLHHREIVKRGVVGGRMWG